MEKGFGGGAKETGSGVNEKKFLQTKIPGRLAIYLRQAEEKKCCPLNFIKQLSLPQLPVLCPRLAFLSDAQSKSEGKKNVRKGKLRIR